MDEDCNNVCPSSMAASSSPMLLRLAHRHEQSSENRAAASSSSSSSPRQRRVSPVTVSLVVLLVAMVMASSPSNTASAQEMATIAPASCPDGCSCFFTLMYCYNVNRVPPIISPATKFVSISSVSFINPVLSRSNFSSGYENVEDISIQYTNLATIQNQAFDNLRRVRYISLDHNYLRTLPSSMLRVLARAKFVSLFSNQWNCNKDLAWLYEVYRSNPDKFGSGCLDADCRFVSQVRCDGPANFRNLDFVNITFTQYQQMQVTP